MKFFIDSADINEIKNLKATGLVDGITTNPTLIAKATEKTDHSFKDIIKEMCALIPGPVSAEVAATDFKTMMAEANTLRAIADNVVIKLPLTFDGLQACKHLSDEGTAVNVTLCFSANQALLAAKAGASYISPFLGRLDDIGIDGTTLIADIAQIYDNYGFTTEILAASIRHPLHLMEVARLGADVATLPPKVLRQLFNHPLTDLGLDAFLKDWEKSGQHI